MFSCFKKLMLVILVVALMPMSIVNASEITTDGNSDQHRYAYEIPSEPTCPSPTCTPTPTEPEEPTCPSPTCTPTQTCTPTPTEKPTCTPTLTEEPTRQPVYEYPERSNPQTGDTSIQLINNTVVVLIVSVLVFGFTFLPVRNKRKPTPTEKPTCTPTPTEEPIYTPTLTEGFTFLPVRNKRKRE